MCAARCICSSIILGACAVVASANPPDGLARLHEIAKKPQPSEQEYYEAQKILAGIEKNTPQGDATVLASLFDLVSNTNSHGFVSKPALPVLASKADNDYANRIVSLMQSKLDGLKTAPVKADDILHGRDAAKLDCFMEECAIRLFPKVRDPRELLDVLVDCCVLRVGWFRPDAQQKAGRLLSTAPVDLKYRKASALKLIRLTAAQYPYPDGLETIFGPEDVPTLRSLIRAPNNTPETFCWGAADILAHLGDEEAVADVRAFLLRHPTGHASPEDEARGYAFRIELQKPPSKLLGFIRGTTWNGTSRIWAMRRALDYKIDKAAIREAILAHAAATKNHKILKYELPMLKEAAIASGVLTKDDLADVVAPKRVEVTP